MNAAIDARRPRAEEIRKRRRSLAWTQAELARRSGLSVATIENLERASSSRRATPIVQAKLASALTADVADLFEAPAADLDTAAAAERAKVSRNKLIADWRADGLSALNCEPDKPGRAAFAIRWDPAEIDRYRAQRAAARAALWIEAPCGCGCGELARQRRRGDRRPRRIYKRGHYNRAPGAQEPVRRRSETRAKLEQQAGGCWSHTCPDPDCGVEQGRCHRAGCRERAWVADRTVARSRYVIGTPTLFCSSACAFLALNLEGVDPRQLERKLRAGAGGCGSPTCTDPECEVEQGRCHRPGCENAAITPRKTASTHRHLAGEPGLYCSKRCVRLARNLGESDLAELRRLAREGYVIRVPAAAAIIGRKPAVIWKHAVEWELGRRGPNQVLWLRPDDVKDLQERLKPYDDRAMTPADAGEWGRHSKAIARANGKRPGPKRQLGDAEPELIREGLAAGDSLRQIAEQVGVSPKQVRGVVEADKRARRRPASRTGRPPAEIPPAMRRKILELERAGLSVRAIALKAPCSRRIVNNVLAAREPQSR